MYFQCLISMRSIASSISLCRYIASFTSPPLSAFTIEPSPRIIAPCLRIETELEKRRNQKKKDLGILAYY